MPRGAVIPAIVDAAGNPSASLLLIFGTNPVAGTHGATMTAFTVRVCDAYGATRTGDSSTAVTIALVNAMGATISAGTNPQTAVAGIATFNDIQISIATGFGVYYQFIATAPGLVSGYSSNFSMA